MAKASDIIDIDRVIRSIPTQTSFYRTGFPLLDFYIGGTVNIHDESGKIIRQEARPGIAGGTINQVWGQSQSGKTTLLSQMGANTIRQFEKSNLYHIDGEGRFDLTRAENITRLPPDMLEPGSPRQKYFLINDGVSFQSVKSLVMNRYAEKMSHKDEFLIETGETDEFNRPVKVFQPDVLLLDSLPLLIGMAFDPLKEKELSAMSELKLRGNGPGEALTTTAFFKDIAPVCKAGNIQFNFINQRKTKIQMSPFTPNQKDMPFMTQDETFSGGRVVQHVTSTILKMSHGGEVFTMETDGFDGRSILVEPTKCTYNLPGNKKSGIYFYLVLDDKHGFDSLRSMILWARERGLIEGNRNRLKFKGHDEFTFNWKNLNQEKKEKPIWDCVREVIYPALHKQLQFVDPDPFDENLLNY